jgi:hypothetical protein
MIGDPRILALSTSSSYVTIDTVQKMIFIMPNRSFIAFQPTPPIVAQYPALLRRSWRIIRERRATNILTGHGMPFSEISLVMSV